MVSTVDILGRAELLGAVRAGLAAGNSVLLAGVAGIGKSTVLAAVAEEVAGTGAQVLRCSPARTDAGLPFLALVDLLDPVPKELFDRLPPAPRERWTRPCCTRTSPVNSPSRWRRRPRRGRR